jgi:hypothetical protein
MPKPSRNGAHHRIARFTAVISSHPKNSSNRAAPSRIETRNQLPVQSCSAVLSMLAVYRLCGTA